MNKNLILNLFFLINFDPVNKKAILSRVAYILYNINGCGPIPIGDVIYLILVEIFKDFKLVYINMIIEMIKRSRFLNEFNDGNVFFNYFENFNYVNINN